MGLLRVEVVCAWPDRHQAVTLELEHGATAGDAARASGIRAEHSGLAIYGEPVGDSALLREGDRVELLRPLAIDPKDARRRRARNRYRGAAKRSTSGPKGRPPQ